MDLLSELPNFTVEDALTKRMTCTVCARPSPVCVCYAINERAYTDTTVSSNILCMVRVLSSP